MSVATEITRLQNAKTRLKEILIDKNVTVGNERLDELVELTEEIKGGSGTDTTDATASANDILKGKTAYVNGEKVEGTIETYGLEMSEGAVSGNTLKNLLDNTKSTYYLFYGYKGTTTKNLIQYSDTENVQNFNSTYRECTKLTEVMATDTRNGIDFSQKYRSCIYVEKFPQIDTSNGTDFTYLYENDWSATYVPPLITNKATRIAQMYASCSRIPKIDITHYKISSTSNCNQWCYNCKSLKAVIIRSFGDTYVLNNNSFQNCYWLLGQTDSTYNPNGEQGYIYVPRDMIATLQSATNWSTLQFRVLEDYTKDGTTTGEFDDVKAGLV